MEFLFLLHCSMTVIVNKTDSWTEQDVAVLNRAAEVCRSKYRNSPCVREFRKLEETRYQVICGGPK